MHHDTTRSHERGAALMIVAIVLVVILVGGLAAIAITNGSLSSSRGFRAQATTEACAKAALERVRALLPDATFDASAGTINAGGTTLTYRASHYTGDSGASPILELDATNFDANALYQGENITNTMGSIAGGNLSDGLRMLTTTAVCSGAGYGSREMQIVFRYGVPNSGR